MATRGHLLKFIGMAGGCRYRLDAGTIIALPKAEPRADSERPEGESGDMHVKGVVFTGVDKYEYWGSREVRVSDPDAVRVMLKAQGADEWVDRTPDEASEITLTESAPGGGVSAREAGGSGGENGSTPDVSTANSPSMQERKERAASDADSQFIDVGDVVEIHSAEDYRRAWDSIQKDYSGVHAFAVADGTYWPGTIQKTIIHTQGADRLTFCGNWEAPSRVRVPANHNISTVIKDEHYRMEGMEWGRSQHIGPGFYRDMHFPHGAGGKPASGFWQNCRFGDPEDPPRWAFVARRTGSAFLGAGCELHAAGPAHICRPNSATVTIHPDVEFGDGELPVVSDRDVKPDDLGPGKTLVGVESRV